MRRSITALTLMIAALACASRAAAQAPPPAPAPPAPAAPPPAAPAPAPAPPAAAPAPAGAPAPAPAAAPAPTPPPAPETAPPGAPAAAPGAPASPAPPGNWYDKFAVDAFVDAYGAVNYNFPKPQAPLVNPAVGALATGGGGNSLRAFDIAQGFALNWAGVNASYTADPIGGTIGLRFGPAATVYNAGPDNAYGLTYVKQAYATWKPASKVTLDFGKWDQPFGSEVADSQLNMNYSRSLLFWYAQPLFYTGLRFDYAASDMFDLKLFAANGWNNSIDNNVGKTFGAQIMLKPADQAIFYIGYVGGPEQNDFTLMTPTAMAGATPGGPTIGINSEANSHWRHLVDFVADINPTKDLRFLLNFDYRNEDFTPDHTESIYGANLVIRYNFSDAFYASVRGEYFHDEHTDTVPSKNVEDGTLTLAYSIGSHLALMFDAIRFDIADDPIFQTVHSSEKSQITSMLGVIASTK
jgi:putative OmpL-like beta-barrel porin-2